jgi:hypothetical protein
LTGVQNCLIFILNMFKSIERRNIVDLAACYLSSLAISIKLAAWVATSFRSGGMSTSYIWV